MRNLPHLEAALHYRGTAGNQCVQRSAALMLDMPGATLVFGVLRAATPEEQATIKDASPVPFIHAWVEKGIDLYAPTLIERMGMALRPMLVEDYYQVNGISKTWRLQYADFMKVARRWKLSSAFRYGSQRAGHADVADALLKAAGVRYVLSDRRTLLPADDGEMTK